MSWGPQSSSLFQAAENKGNQNGEKEEYKMIVKKARIKNASKDFFRTGKFSGDSIDGIKIKRLKVLSSEQFGEGSLESNDNNECHLVAIGVTLKTGV